MVAFLNGQIDDQPLLGHFRRLVPSVPEFLRQNEAGVFVPSISGGAVTGHHRPCAAVRLVWKPVYSAASSATLPLSWRFSALVLLALSAPSRDPQPCGETVPGIERKFLRINPWKQGRETAAKSSLRQNLFVLFELRRSADDGRRSTERPTTIASTLRSLKFMTYGPYCHHAAVPAAHRVAGHAPNREYNQCLYAAVIESHKDQLFLP
ncbi:unnamed protein product [Soboliphyme baturini]|uniref:Uncharacterized protein n=1 Tax=Soboliphyme baturini TaxID=241478 RepID=A0A183ITM4_9BILA|nr:unnamed protein product [Soboliphyme baturini]